MNWWQREHKRLVDEYIRDSVLNDEALLRRLIVRAFLKEGADGRQDWHHVAWVVASMAGVPGH